MDKYRSSFGSYISPLCIFGAVLGALACFVRPDYNLPLYMFIYVMRRMAGNQGGEKIKMLVLMFITWVVDFVWLLYWAPFYRSEKMKDWEYGIHMFTIVIVIIEFIFKLVMMGILLLVDQKDIEQVAKSNQPFIDRNTLRSNHL